MSEIKIAELICIGLGVAILIVIMVLFGSVKSAVRRTSNNTYDTGVYYGGPYSNMMRESRYGGLNDIVTLERELPLHQYTTNQQAARWAGGIESQNDNDDSNTRWFTNTDITVEPMDLHRELKTIEHLKMKNVDSSGPAILYKRAQQLFPVNR